MEKIKYIYSGAPSWVTLREKDKKGKPVQTEIPLRPGAEVELDPTNPYVISLVGRGLLEKCKDADAPVEATAETPTDVTAETPAPETLETLVEAPTDEPPPTEISSKKGRR